jgi:hypothetical protein
MGAFGAVLIDQSASSNHMARVHSRVVCEVRRADLRRVTRVFGGRREARGNPAHLHSPEPRQARHEASHWSVPTQDLQAGAIHPHLAGTDAGRGITEDVALLKETVSIQGYIHRTLHLSVKREETLPTYTRQNPVKRATKRLTGRFFVVRRRHPPAPGGH